MTSAPTTTNQAATFTNSALHAIIFDVAVKSAEAAMIADVPILGFPIIKQINEFLLNLFANRIYGVMALGSTFAIIDAQTSQEAAATNQTATLLKAALAGNDPNAITQAKNNFEQAFAKLTHYDGSASP